VAGLVAAAAAVIFGAALAQARNSYVYPVPWPTELRMIVGTADWLLRITPAAAFAVQQATPQYQQVTAIYSPNTGFFPLAPWAGFAVLCGYAALALGLAVVLLRRRDA